MQGICPWGLVKNILYYYSKITPFIKYVFGPKIFVSTLLELKKMLIELMAIDI
jgi:hypothetical protein